MNSRINHRYPDRAGQKPRAVSDIPDYLMPLMHIASRISGKPAAGLAELEPANRPIC